jgi:hypothetical protein
VSDGLVRDRASGRVEIKLCEAVVCFHHDIYELPIGMGGHMPWVHAIMVHGEPADFMDFLRCPVDGVGPEDVGTQVGRVDELLPVAFAEREAVNS